MAYKKRFSRFSRRRSRKGVSRNVQTLSLCARQYAIEFGPDGAGGHDGTCAQPVVFVSPLAHGGTWFSTPNTVPGAPGLSSEAARGVSVRGIQFDHSSWATCYTSSFTEDVGIVVGHYFALIRADFDTLTYSLNGTVVPDWPRLPNIIQSDLYVATAASGGPESPVFDREEDIFFRGFEEMPIRNCDQCPALVQSESCEALAPPPIMVVPALSSSQMQNFSRAYNVRHIKLRTGRFLKPNQALFWVDNFVCSLANTSFTTTVGFNQTVYGSLTTRVAR